MNNVYSSPRERMLISIVSPTYNEAENVEMLYRRLKEATAKEDKYDFEIIFIDNKSTDETVLKIKGIAASDKSVKLIVNTRNFGHIRSPYHGILQAKGRAVVYLASDLQDPPEMLGQFIRGWEEGFKVVWAVKPKSSGPWLSHQARKSYYRVLNAISETEITPDATGFGLYDELVIAEIRAIADPYPYFRGMVSDLGFKIKTIEFEQPRRIRGVTKNNWYSLYDIAMLAFVSHSRIPLRLAALIGYLVGALSLTFGAYFITRKILNWDGFQLGISPILVGMFFLGGVQLICLGIIGEYLSSVLTYVRRRPVVIEEERVNF